MGVKQTKFKVILAFEHFRVGQIIEPTGLWRGELLRMKFIEPFVEPELKQEVRQPRKKRIASDAL